MLGNEVVGYQVKVKGLRHRDGTREVVQFSVAGFNTEMSKATVNEGLGTAIVELAGCLLCTLTCLSFSSW